MKPLEHLVQAEPEQPQAGSEWAQATELTVSDEKLSSAQER